MGVRGPGYSSGSVWRRLKEPLGRAARTLIWRESRGKAAPDDDGYNTAKDAVGEDVFVLQPSGVVVRWPRTVRRDLTHAHWSTPLRMPLWQGFAARVLTRRLDALAEAALGIHPYCGNEYNHYHFLIDVVPRLLAYLDEPTMADVPILVNAPLRRSGPFRHFLEINRLPDSRFICPPGSVARVGRLHVANRPGFSPAKFARLRSVFGCPKVGAPEKRLFLTRSLDQRRPLLNQAAIADALRPHGFQAVDFSGRSMTEQMRLAASARYVVAVHGAGITNFIFHEPGSMALMELRPEWMKYQRFYEEIAAAMGFAYERLSGPSADGDGFELDPSAVLGAVERMLAGEFGR